MFEDSATFLANIAIVTYWLVIQTAEDFPQSLGDLDDHLDCPSDIACKQVLLEFQVNERRDQDVDTVNDGKELLPVGFAGHSVNLKGFVGESFVDIRGMDKGLAFLKGNIELADGVFVLAGADVLFWVDVFFRRHGYLVSWMDENLKEMLDTNQQKWHAFIAQMMSG